MKKPKYIPIYKCRLCGERFTISTPADIMVKMDELPQREVHLCADGGVGLADFQGFREEIRDEHTM